MRLKKPLKVGVDMDGVIAKHSFGGFWVWIRKFKERLFKKAGSDTYYYPANVIERFAWVMINWKRKPSISEKEFYDLIKTQNLEFYLVTSRFKFLEKMTHKWLEKYNLRKFFKLIKVNVDDFDPLVYKHQAVKALGLDYFIDDDFELIEYLNEKSDIELFWVVPGHRHKHENGYKHVYACDSLYEAIDEIVNRQ